MIKASAFIVASRTDTSSETRYTLDLSGEFTHTSSDVGCPKHWLSAFPHPLLRDRTTLDQLVDDENQLIVVITVLHLDIDASVSHSTRQSTELARLDLTQSQSEDLAVSDDTNPRSFQTFARCVSIVDQKMRD
jgi:hypothetical protein